MNPSTADLVAHKRIVVDNSFEDINEALKRPEGNEKSLKLHTEELKERQK